MTQHFLTLADFSKADLCLYLERAVELKADTLAGRRNRSLEGKILAQQMTMYWDAGARKRNLSDARYVMRVRDIEYDAACSLWPEAAEDDLHAGWADGMGSRH